jgi:hypothetical protein
MLVHARPRHQQPNATRQCDASDKRQTGDRAQCDTLQSTFCGLKRLPFMSEPFLPMLLLSPLTRRCRQFNGMTPRSTTRYA